MFEGISRPTHLPVILVIVLIIFETGKLHEPANSSGKAVGGFPIFSTFRHFRLFFLTSKVSAKGKVNTGLEMYCRPACGGGVSLYHLPSEGVPGCYLLTTGDLIYLMGFVERRI